MAAAKMQRRVAAIRLTVERPKRFRRRRRYAETADAAWPEARVIDDKVILPLDNPMSRAGATYILRGNLAPRGCVIKPTAAEKRLLKHTGPAIVFKDYADMKERMDDENLNVTADSVLVLQSAGPMGAPGMPGAKGTPGGAMFAGFGMAPGSPPPAWASRMPDGSPLPALKLAC